MAIQNDRSSELLFGDGRLATNRETTKELRSLTGTESDQRWRVDRFFVSAVTSAGSGWRQIPSHHAGRLRHCSS
jgi:hypothetical protein